MPVPTLDNQVQFYDFKGLNIDKPKDLIDDDQMSEATNVVFRKGRVKKRPGLQLVASYPLSGTVGKMVLLGIDTGLGNGNTATFYFYDVDKLKIVATQNFAGALTKVSGAANVDFVNTAIWNSDTGLGPLFCGSVGGVNGAYVMAQFVSGAVNPGLLTAGRGYDLGIFMHFDRIWTYGGLNINYSDPGVGTNIGVGTRFVGLPNNIDEAYPFNDKIVISTVDGLYLLNINGTPRTWTLNKVKNNSRGFVRLEGTRTRLIVEMDKTLYILTPDGVLKYDGQDFTLLSQAINNEFDESDNQFQDSYSIGIWSLRNKEIFVKINGRVTDDVNNKLKYYIYNTVEGSWSKFETSIVTPGTALIFNPIYSATPDITNYTYDVINFYNLYDDAVANYPAPVTNTAQAIAASNFARAMQGMYCMSNLFTNEPNKIYRIPEHEDQWTYTDNGNKFTSTIESKLFDFGFRGTFKKCLKQYYSIDVTSNVFLNIIHMIDSVTSSSIGTTVTPATRMLKVRGPGYFQEYAYRIQDVTGHPDYGGWELQTVGMDIINKAEQLASRGT